MTRKQKRQFKNYKKFLLKNREKIILDEAIYGKSVVEFVPWKISNILKWIFLRTRKPGFHIVNPENIDLPKI